MLIPPVRTITLGIADAHPLSPTIVQQASMILEKASKWYSEVGYEVQTVRLSTRPIFNDLAAWPNSRIVSYTLELQKMLDDYGLGFCSIGTAQAARTDFSLTRLELIPELLIPTSALSTTVQLATLENALRTEALRPVARVIQRLAQETVEGFGNFRFAMIACVPPGCPFFPSAYHEGPSSLSLGLQGASIVAAALQGHQAHTPLDLVQVTHWVRKTLVEHAKPIVDLGQRLAREHQLSFGGIDLSPAPLGEDSIAAAIELCGYGPVGSFGTLAVASAITAALKSSELPTCGYCGLMLPVLEDARLGRHWKEEQITVHQLLLYSAICGTGLDTIPLPGDSSSAIIEHLLLDVAALALRLQKPLSARLFPVSGKRAGEWTNFTSPYLTNTLIRNVF